MKEILKALAAWEKQVPKIPEHNFSKYDKVSMVSKGQFTHKIEGPWPLQSKSSHWLKGQNPFKFTSHTKVKA